MAAPLFIKIDEYKDVLDIIALLKSKVKEGKEIVGKINDLKNQEDSELDTWTSELEDIEKRIKSIDGSLLRV